MSFVDRRFVLRAVAACAAVILLTHPAIAGEESATPTNPPTSSATTVSAPDQFRLTAGTMQGQPPTVTWRGNARLVSGEWTLTADEIHYNYNTHEAEAVGDVLITRPGLRVLGERAHYWTQERRVDIANFRLGQPPYHLAGRRAHGTAEELICEDVVIHYGEPGPLTPHAEANRIVIRGDRTFSADALSFRVGAVPVFALAGLSRSWTAPTIDWETRAGFDATVGLHAGTGLYVPWRPNFSPGGSLDVYSKRGVLFGPGARYGNEALEFGAAQLRGEVDVAYISDTGNTAVDNLDRPIDKHRSFATWRHIQRGAQDRWTFNGQLDWWSDSDITRDFRPSDFERNQEPDNFVEASWYASQLIVSALVRGRPNDFQVVRERLPEVRVDVMPQTLGDTGILLHGEASAVALREKPLGNNDVSGRRSDRLDAYLGASRTFVVAKGTTVTPVLGARGTHYLDAEGGRSSYTRWLGEIGFDARMCAFRTWELDQPRWGIEAVRHIIEPYVSYRYVPRANRGAAYIPDIDRPVFLPQLQPLGLAGRRDIDELGEIDTLRLGLTNLLETRRPDYGSRRVLRFDLGADWHFSDSHAARRVPDIFAEFHLTPADWLNWWTFMRVDPEEPWVNEFNTRFEIAAGRQWSAGFGVDFLRRDVSQYVVFGRYALSEVNQIIAGVRYDARAHRFNDIELGFVHRLHQNWELGYSVRKREGTRRESGWGLRIDLQFLTF